MLASMSGQGFTHYTAKKIYRGAFQKTVFTPTKHTTMDEAADYLQHRPNEKFMLRYLMTCLQDLTDNGLERLLETARKQQNFTLIACLYYTCSLRTEYHKFLKKFQDVSLDMMGREIPSLRIKLSSERGEQIKSEQYWQRMFFNNRDEHMPLPPLEMAQNYPSFPVEDTKASQKAIAVKDIHSNTRNIGSATTAPDETIKKVLDNTTIRKMSIKNIAKITAFNMYFISADWILDQRVSVGRNRWIVRDYVKACGKSRKFLTSKEGSIASFLMEIVERYSALADFAEDQSIGYEREFKLVKSRYSDFKVKEQNVLDPRKVNLTMPYKDEELYWLIAQEIDERGEHEIYIPAQLVFLSQSENFDEVDIASVDTTGLASGNTMEGAKLHGLLECIERDGYKTIPYTPDRVFGMDSEIPVIKNMLNGLSQKNAYIQLLDLSSELRVPCYEVFIETEEGIFSGYGADLDGKIAVNAALGEMLQQYVMHSPCPSVKPASKNVVRYEELPNYASGDIITDLNILERLLIMNGLHPIYVDLTRKELDIPVVRVIIPGLDRLYGKISKRQFRNYQLQH